MGLEVGTYVSDLVSSNPVGATDSRRQGDDHLRLIKAVLQATFPNASHLFNFPAVQAQATTYNIVAADHNKTFACDASGGAFTLVLPSSGYWSGFEVEVMKVDSSGNAITVDGAGADTINGSADESISTQWEAKRYIWSGSAWYSR